MSSSDSDSEKDKIRRTKRSVVVKFQFKDSDTSSGDSDTAGPSIGTRSKCTSKKNASTSSESTSDSNNSASNSQRKRKCSKPYIYAEESDASTDDSWSPIKLSNRQCAATTTTSVPNNPTEAADKTLTDTNVASSDTDSSGDLTEKCPICLHSFRGQEIGTPNVCDHSFCAPCIDEWSGNVQTCPIDRKPFTSIRIRSRYENGKFLRETEVQTKASKLQTEFDFTNCEICNLSDREDSMLLCDSCNDGYHMDCLVPALTQIPEGSWYCDNCFASESSEEDINRLIEEMEEIGVPETRLRVRRAVAPRITRTRQSERIRATIRSRRRENQSDLATLFDMPGTSRGRNTQTITTTTATTTKSKVVRRNKTTRTRKRRRRTYRRRKTYVVEYDVDSYDNKFSIKSTKRVIKRRRKTKIRRKTKTKCSNRKQTQNNLDDEALAGLGIISRTSNTGLKQHYPKLHIFGNKNALDYFSDESDNEDGPLNNSIQNGDGDGLLIMSSSRTMGGSSRRLLRHKNIALNSTAEVSSVDVLSNIMDTMDRWHSMTRPTAIEKIKINNNGSLVADQPVNDSPNTSMPANLPHTSKPPNSDILNAPMYPRNGPPNDGSNYNSNFNSPNGGFRAGSGTPNQNAGNYSFNRNSDGGGRSADRTPFQPFQRGNNFNQTGFDHNLPGNDYLPRNLPRTPLRQRGMANNNRFLRNQFRSSLQRTQQGLYDGEDIAPLSDASLAAQPSNHLIQIDTTAMKEPRTENEFVSDNRANKRVRTLEPPPMPPMFDFGDETPFQISEIATVERHNQSDILEISTSQSTAVLCESTPLSRQQAVKTIIDYPDSDDAIDCPVFEYSTESMEAAKTVKESAGETVSEPEQCMDTNMENDEDLVQLDDDEHLPNDHEQSTMVCTEKANEMQNESNKTSNDKMESSSIESEMETITGSHVIADRDKLEATADTESPVESLIKRNVNESNNDDMEKNAPEEVIEADERSYTPCLDEQINSDEGTKENNSEDERNDDLCGQQVSVGGQKSESASLNAGIEGMDTELISDDENDNILCDDEASKVLRGGEEKNNRKSERDELFKKVSKTIKDRQYRGDKRDGKAVNKHRGRRTKSKSKSRSRSRSRLRSYSHSISQSRSKSKNRGDRRGADRRDRFRRIENKHPELQRYDVRDVIADRKPKKYKDKFGRDTSRPPRSRSLSTSLRQSISKSADRLLPPNYPSRRCSVSKRRSVSRHRSTSRKRSLSRRLSPSRHRPSVSRNSPRRRRRSVLPRLRSGKSNSRSTSRRSPVRRSPVRRSAIRRSPIKRSPLPPYYPSSRSRSKGRLINGQQNIRPLRSRTRSRSRSYSPKPIQNNLYDMHKSRSHSPNKVKNKIKRKPGDKKATKTRTKKKVHNTKRMSPFRSPNRRDVLPTNHNRIDHQSRSISRSKSWNNPAASWNHSLSNVPNEGELPWTPPITHAPDNLTIFLKNKEGKRKREKKRKTDKRKVETQQRKEKRKQRADKQNAPAMQLKEVFASGDNILVSVSFNKDKQQQSQQQQLQQQTTIVTLPPSKDQIVSKKQSERDGLSKRSRRTNRDGPRKHQKVNIKPVAIIDLDNSPFKEMTPSPRAVIILSDSDHENDKTNKTNKNQSLNYSMASTATESNAKIDVRENREINSIRISSPSQSSPAQSVTSFEMSLGPKTPPEPHLVKFSISTNAKTKIRTVVNPLHDDTDDDDDDDEQDAGGRENIVNKEPNSEIVNATADKAQNIANVQSQQKIGPNTPPDSEPYSPDVYDPFDPTKSPSMSPSDNSVSTGADKNDSQQQQKSANGTCNVDDQTNKLVKPVDLVMALINSKTSIDAANSMLSSTLEGDNTENDMPNEDVSNVSPYKDKSIIDDTSKSSNIHVFNNMLLTPAKDSSSRTQAQQSRSGPLSLSTLTNTVNTTSTSKIIVSSTPTKRSPMKYGSGSLISKLPMPPKSKPITRHNGNDNNMDIDSPYSPGSSEYEDLFEQPQSPQASSGHVKKHSARAASSTTFKVATSTTAGAAGKIDIFDDLFGSTTPVNKNSNKTAAKRRQNKRSSTIKEWIAVSKQSNQYGKLNEDNLRILEEWGSAVEPQVKDKYLKKLNRQERVVEEIKLVLKPHYNKQHISKEDYKDILRRAVPKICHNRTGEINPKKIKNLIEAYVNKFRQKRK